MIDIFDIKAAVFVKHINTAAAFISPNTILDHTSKENLMKNRSPASAKNTALGAPSVRKVPQGLLYLNEILLCEMRRSLVAMPFLPLRMAFC